MTRRFRNNYLRMKRRRRRRASSRRAPIKGNPWKLSSCANVISTKFIRLTFIISHSFEI
jgi:hypothetical protein